MQFEALLIIDVGKAQEDPELNAEIESWVFGANYEKICKIKKLPFGPVTEDNVLRSLYELHFFRGEDATAFKLKFQYAIYDPTPSSR